MCYGVDLHALKPLLEQKGLLKLTIKLNTRFLKGERFNRDHPQENPRAQDEFQWAVQKRAGTEAKGALKDLAEAMNVDNAIL